MIRLCVLSAAVCLAVSPPAIAQATMLRGVIYDPIRDREPYAGIVQIVARHEPSGRRWTTRSSGLYQIDRLPAGHYSVTVDVPPSKVAADGTWTPPSGSDDGTGWPLTFYDEIDVKRGLRTALDIVLRQTTLRGMVYDPSGRIIENARVEIRDEATGQLVGVRNTSLLGLCSFSLPPGRYLVTVTSGDYRQERVPIYIPPGRMQAFSVRLNLVSAESILVTGTNPHEPVPPIHGLPAAGLGAIFDRETIDSSLVGGRGRTVQSLLPLTPGVATTESVGTLAQFTAVGQRRFSNRLTIDGMSADLAVDMTAPALDESGSGGLPALAASGGTQTLVPFSAVQEIQIRTTNSAPAYARAPGAQTEIVTRAGGDRFEGAAFGEARPRALAAADYFRSAGGAPRRFASQSGGLSLGGPIRQRHLTFFAATEYQRVDRPYEATVPLPSDALRASVPATARTILDAFPRANGADAAAGLAEYSEAFRLGSALITASLRTDLALGERHRVFMRVNVGSSRGDAVRSPGQQPDYTFRHTESTATRTATVGVLSMLSGRTVHDLRVNVSQHRGSLVASSAGTTDLDLAALAPNAINPWVRVVALPGPAGAVQAGRTGGSEQTQMEVVDTWTLARGRHEWRLGLDASDVLGSVPGSTRYTYTLTPLAQLQQGRARVSIEERQPARARFLTAALFVQDTMRVSSRLSLTYGLRYSVAPAPSSGTDLEPAVLRAEDLPAIEPRTGGPLWRTSWGSLGPHVTAAYHLVTTAGQETSLRGGWDRVFDELTSPGGSAFGSGAPYVTRRVVVLPTALPIAPEALAVAPVAEGSERYAFPEELRRPHTDRWYLSLDRALGDVQRISVAYAGNRSRDLVYRSAYVQSSGAPVYLFTNDAAADYQGLLVDYTRRRARGLQGTIAYTWSHAIDNDSGESPAPNLPPGVFDPQGNRGSADYDRRHLLHARASYQAPAWNASRLTHVLTDGWQIDVVGTARSGAPVTVEALRGLSRLRSDIVEGVPQWIDDDTSPTGRRINPAAFIAPTTGQHGTLGRNALRGSPLWQLDAAISRAVPLGARASLLLRCEAFNVLNVSNFGPPDVFRVDGFGAPAETAADAFGTGTLSQGGLVAVQQLGGPRSVQIGARLTW